MCRDDYQETTWHAFWIEMLYGQRRRSSPSEERFPQQKDTLRRDAAQFSQFALCQTDSQYAGIGEIRPGSDRPRKKVAIAMLKILLNEREEGRFNRDDKKEGVQLIQGWIRIL